MGADSTDTPPQSADSPLSGTDTSNGQPDLGPVRDEGTPASDAAAQKPGAASDSLGSAEMADAHPVEASSALTRDEAHAMATADLRPAVEEATAPTGPLETANPPDTPSNAGEGVAPLSAVSKTPPGQGDDTAKALAPDTLSPETAPDTDHFTARQHASDAEPDGPLTPMDKWEVSEDRKLAGDIIAHRAQQDILRQQGNEQGAQELEDFISKLPTTDAIKADPQGYLDSLGNDEVPPSAREAQPETGDGRASAEPEPAPDDRLPDDWPQREPSSADGSQATDWQTAAGPAAVQSEEMSIREGSEDRILRDNAEYFDAEAQRYRELGDHDAAIASQEAGDRARSAVGDSAQPNSADTQPDPTGDNLGSAGTWNQDRTGEHDSAGLPPLPPPDGGNGNGNGNGDGPSRPSATVEAAPGSPPGGPPPDERLPHQPDTQRPIVIGEQQDRVEYAASMFDAETYTGLSAEDAGLPEGSEELRTAQLKHNEDWISRMREEGRLVIDTGPAEQREDYPLPTRPREWPVAPYEVELSAIDNYPNVIRPWEDMTGTPNFPWKYNSSTYQDGYYKPEQDAAAHAASDATTAAGSEAMGRWEASEVRIPRDNADYFAGEAQRYRDLGDHDAASASQEAGERTRSLIGGSAQPNNAATPPSPTEDHVDSVGTGSEDRTGGQAGPSGEYAARDAAPPSPPPDAPPSSVRPGVAEIARAQIEGQQVTPDLEGIAADTGGTMLGLEHSIKSQESLKRKVAHSDRDPTDVLRYTMAFPHNQIADGAKAAMKSLEANGYQVDELNNGWLNPVPGDYRGINTTVESPTGYRFELQFHTPESFAVKEAGTHDLYEVVRDKDLSVKDRDEAELAARLYSATLLVPPPGIEHIAPFSRP